jgi:Carbohydrate binding module (family 35)
MRGLLRGVVADYVHHDGLKFGLYVTPGIPKQAVARNTAIEGTGYHVDDIATTTAEKNYNCKGMGFVGNGGTLTVTGVSATSAGSYQVTIAYLDGSTIGRQATISVNGGTPQMVSFTPTGSFNTVGTMTVSLPLAAGNNTIRFANPADYAPDFDRIIVAATPG